jgi:hypothetical protein
LKIYNQFPNKKGLGPLLLL